MTEQNHTFYPTTKITRSGQTGSLTVTIPRQITEHLQLTTNDYIEWSVKTNKKGQTYIACWPKGR